MKKSRITADRDNVISVIDKRITGQFLEHLRNLVYPQTYDPDHPLADEQGLRRDVIDEIKRIGIPLVRYPGGNMVSAYDWKDGIGPKESRPTKWDTAWRTIESNQFGTDDFMDFARKAGFEAMLAVNLGTGTPRDAMEMVDYCNRPNGTYFSDLRAKNGHKDPYNVKVWCLGNEMDGMWQACNMSAYEYGVKARQAAQLMKRTDPTLELVAAGSSGYYMNNFMEWNRETLEQCYEDVEYLSIHQYFDYLIGENIYNYLASDSLLDRYIKDSVLACDYVKGKLRSSKTINISLDEWNTRQSRRYASLPEEVRNMDGYQPFLDSLVNGSIWLTILNNADRVKIGCETMIYSSFQATKDGILRQPHLTMLEKMIKYAKGEAIRLITVTDTLPTDLSDSIPLIKTASAYDEDAGSFALFIYNPYIEANEVDITMRHFGEGKEFSLVEHCSFAGEADKLEDLIWDAIDVPKSKTAIFAKDITPASAADFSKHGKVIIPALSWNMLRFNLK